MRMWNVETPSGSGHEGVAGKPTVRKAELSGGSRMAQEANAGAPKGDRTTGTRRLLQWPPVELAGYRADARSPKGR